MVPDLSHQYKFHWERPTGSCWNRIVLAKGSTNCGRREASKPFLQGGDSGVVGVGEQEMVHNLKFGKWIETSQYKMEGNLLGRRCSMCKSLTFFRLDKLNSLFFFLNSLLVHKNPLLSMPFQAREPKKPHHLQQNILEGNSAAAPEQDLLGLPYPLWFFALFFAQLCPWALVLTSLCLVSVHRCYSEIGILLAFRLTARFSVDLKEMGRPRGQLAKISVTLLSSG